MAINLSDIANNFTLVADSFEHQNHSYIAIERDENNCILGCNLTFERKNRASLSEINELVETCLKSNSLDTQTLNNIQSGLDTIQAKVLEANEQSCCGIWFWLMSGNSIVEKSMRLLTVMNNLAKTLINPENKIDSKEDSAPNVTFHTLNDENHQNDIDKDNHKVSHSEEGSKFHTESTSLSSIDENHQENINTDSSTASQSKEILKSDDKALLLNLFSEDQQKQINAYNKKLPLVEEDAKDQFQKIDTYSREIFNEKDAFELLPFSPDVNRYKDAMPYKNNYIGEDGNMAYVNASKISIHGINYIATQGPKQETIKQFITMVVNSGGTVVTVTNETEGGMPKCYNYWSSKNHPIVVDGWKLALLEDRELYNNWDFFSANHQMVQKRTFSLSKDQEPNKVFTQFHLVNWPDFGTPDDRAFDALLKAVEEHHPQTNSDPIVVHCSAGMGRTGTFIAAHSNRNKIRLEREQGTDKDNISVNLVEDILFMRSKRTGQVQTSNQFTTVQKAINRYQQTL